MGKNAEKSEGVVSIVIRKKTGQPDAGDFAAYNPAEAVAINPANIGSDFSDFLAEEGMLKEVRATALKRVVCRAPSIAAEKMPHSKLRQARSVPRFAEP